MNLNALKVAGLVLAGGRSRRFGRDKALALLNGRPLISHSLRALHGADIIAVNGPKALGAALDLPAVADCQEGGAAGPIAGVLGGLEWAAAQGCAYLLTAPCDTPFLPADLAARFFTVMANRNATVVAARAEREHPLCALWRTDLRDALIAALKPSSDRHPPLRALIQSLGGAWADFPAEAAFVNLNTEAELLAATGWQT